MVEEAAAEKRATRKEAEADRITMPCAVTDRQVTTRTSIAQTGKYVVHAEDLQRARELPCAQRPMKRAEFEKYT